jgi:hypothetical protein
VGKRVGIAFAVALSLGSCTRALYPGPARPNAAVASIGASDTRIDSVDGQWVGDDTFAGHGARYEILPGPHRVGVSLRHLNPGVLVRRGQVSGTVMAHFEAEPGHSYVTVPLIDGSRWEPHVVDEATGLSVSWLREPDDDPK